jgi:hypothetical protein
MAMSHACSALSAPRRLVSPKQQRMAGGMERRVSLDPLPTMTDGAHDTVS